MFKKFRIANQEPCPCNSGKLYNSCCKSKAAKTFHNNNEALHFTGQLMKKSKSRFCLYDGCNAKGKNIIKAHALQENRILNRLAVNGNVKMQDFTQDPTILEIKHGKPEPFYFLTDVAIKTATTATCFCKTHDDKLFAKIEKPQYDLQVLDDEQLFLFAYKTFSFELYTEITAQRFNQLMFTNVPQTVRDPLTVCQYRTHSEKFHDLQYYKNFFNSSIEKRDFSGLETIVLEIPFPIQFSNYMAISPPFDLKGNKLNAMDKKNKRLKFVFFTSFPVDNKSYILVSSLKEDMKYFSNYFEQIKSLPLPLIQYYINVLIPLYSQNLILSPRLWNSWDEKAQFGVQYAVADPHSSKLLLGLRFYLKNISKAHAEHNIDTNNIAFNFFISCVEEYEH